MNELFTEGLLQIGLPLFLIALGYFAGSRAERKHFESLQIREEAYKYFETMSLKRIPANRPEVENATLVTGSVVIAVDYFKVFAAALRNIFGGQVSAYESLVDRARREATLRLKEEAINLGADAVINLRIETTNLSESSNNRGAPNIEALAYGTAVSFYK